MSRPGGRSYRRGREERFSYFQSEIKWLIMLDVWILCIAKTVNFCPL